MVFLINTIFIKISLFSNFFNCIFSRHGRKRKLKPIPVIITLLIVILILGGIYFLLFNGKNKYEDYNTYNETNKQYGTVQHYEKENDDFYISLYYPKFKEKNLNKIIKSPYLPCKQSFNVNN